MTPRARKEKSTHAAAHCTRSLIWVLRKPRSCRNHVLVFVSNNRCGRWGELLRLIHIAESLGDTVQGRHCSCSRYRVYELRQEMHPVLPTDDTESPAVERVCAVSASVCRGREAVVTRECLVTPLERLDQHLIGIVRQQTPRAVQIVAAWHNAIVRERRDYLVFLREDGDALEDVTLLRKRLL